MKLEAIDLCAGAGGLSLGLQRAGFNVLGVEGDPDNWALSERACETHRANVGPCELASITDWHPTKKAILVAGGVPCQSYSQAGAREGTAVEKGRLYEQLIRIGVEAEAVALLIENVEGMMTWRDPDGVGVIFKIEQAMRAAGFLHVRHFVLCAADYGTPQKRYRLFILAFKHAAASAAFRIPYPSHAPPGDMFLPAHVTVRQALSLPAASTFLAGRLEGARGRQGQRNIDVDAPGYCVGTRNNADFLCALDEPAHTVSAGGTSGGVGPEPFANSDYRKRLSRSLGDVLDKPAPVVSATGHDTARDKKRPSRRPIAEVRHAMSLLGAPSHAANESEVLTIAKELMTAGLLDRPATASLGSPETVVAGHHDRQQNGAVRLSVEQLQILQGFPPPSTFTFLGSRTEQHVQVGNAVPPQLGEALGRSIAAAIRAAHVSTSEATAC